MNTADGANHAGRILWSYELRLPASKERPGGLVGTAPRFARLHAYDGATERRTEMFWGWFGDDGRSVAESAQP